MAGQGREAGVRYSGAFRSLVRVFNGNPTLQGGTLYAMTQLSEKPCMVAFLTEVASSRLPSASAAIRILGSEMGNAGIVMLRHLYESDSVVQPSARANLDVLASYHKWSR